MEGQGGTSGDGERGRSVDKAGAGGKQGAEGMGEA